MADFAVVVGIAHYPGLSAEGAAADLEGPDNDAQGVYDWLIDPNGGSLDPANVKLVRSADFAPLDTDDPRPAAVTVERALQWVETQTRRATGGRLYLYFSGHGFSPVLEEGALFTADATQISPSYVYAHAWLRWFRKAQRFHDAVLWMDCCMDFQQSIPVREVLMRAQVGTGVNGPVNIALAAQTKRALERRMPDGNVHGVFTWTLLKGLAGGASDERGQVTGESLRSYLYAVMPEFLPDDAQAGGSVDLQPFVRADQGMVFRVLPDRPKFPVQLTVPAAAIGQELRIWTGRPARRMVSEVLTGAEWSGQLVRGLYVAEISTSGIRHGFQVSGSGDVRLVLSRQGPPVADSDGSELFTFDVEATNPAASIAVLDYQFNRVFSATGELHGREMSGVYKIRVEFGRDITSISDEVLLLDRPLQVGSAVPPQLASPAPIPGSVQTHESHVGPFIAAADRSGPFTSHTSGKAAISVMARYWTPPSPTLTEGLTFPHPMQGLRLVTRGGSSLADLTRDCTVDDQAKHDPVAVWERQLKPGSYFLRLSLPGGRRYEGSIIAARDWVTQLAIRRTQPASGQAASLLSTVGDVAVFMRRAGGAMLDPTQDATIEAARIALTQGRDLFADGRGGQLRDLLLEKYDDPVAGIIGCHLLLRAEAAGQADSARMAQYDHAVANLRGLVGPDHPDVEALSLKCADPGMRAAQPFTAPPMFSHSWQLIAQASYERPELVPLELWQRVHAATTFGAFFIWAADKKTKTAHAEQLSHWISEYAAGTRRRRSATAQPPTAALRDGRRMLVPAAATMALWEGDTSR